MFKTITIKDKYELNPVLSTSNDFDVEVNLFGKNYLFNKSEWMRNVHLKLTDRCNASCWFCIERHSHIKENKEAFIESLARLLDQMAFQNSLFTVTITGGEPTICNYLQDVLDILSKYNVFVTMNTNGRNFPIISNSPDWINISKHDIDDFDIIGIKTLTKDNINEIRINSGSKIRLQSVLTNESLNTVTSILKFIDYYKDVTDDFSFRQLISGSDSIGQPRLTEFREYLFDNAELIEQVFQDYYVYEIWVLNGIKITLSFSDMEMLIKSEADESDSILREIIIHPDGLISGSWNRKSKIIKDLGNE